MIAVKVVVLKRSVQEHTEIQDKKKVTEWGNENTKDVISL
jgi:hypothetical protein